MVSYYDHSSYFEKHKKVEFSNAQIDKINEYTSSNCATIYNFNYSGPSSILNCR